MIGQSPPPIALETKADLLSGWRYRALIGSVILAATGYFGFALWGGWSDVAKAVAEVGFFGTAIAMSLSLVNYILRFIRWQTYLKAMEYSVPWWPSLKIYLAGFALTTTPGKAGEALRGVLLKRWAVPYPTSLAAFLSERLSDLFAVVILTLFGLTSYPLAQPLIVFGAASIMVAFITLSSKGLLTYLYRSVPSPARTPTLLRNLLEILLQARRCHSPRLLIGATGLSLIAWTAEAWAFHLILQWMEIDVPFSLAMFIYAASMLFGALSFMPGGLGSTEVAMTSLLILIGVGHIEATAATILIRMVTLWFAVLIGASFLSFNKIKK